MQPAPTPAGLWARWPDSPTSWDLRDVYFANRNEGWAVGSRVDLDPAQHQPVMLRFSEGRWSLGPALPSAIGAHARLNAVDGTGPDQIWVAGAMLRRDLSTREVGVLFHYDGANWQRLAFPNESLVAPLSDIDVVATEGGYELWAISEANHQNTSFILHFDGESWDVETIQNRSLLGIHMLSTTEGQIVTRGAGGAPDGHHYWYHDGFWQGTSVWTPQPLNAVFMTEPTYGWAVGNRGATDEYVGQCHSPDQSCSWYARQAMRSIENTAISPHLYALQLLSREEGWVVGAPWNGKSTVARLVFEPAPKWRMVPVQNDPVRTLYGLTMLAGPDGRAVEGWAVGAAGTILHYQAPEPTGTATPTATVTLQPAPTVSPTNTRQPTRTPSPTSGLPTPVTTVPASLTPGPRITSTATVAGEQTRPPVEKRYFLPLVQK